eukprot:scaffold2061_cov246-Pinguiococcus_pyrenoidosus.AAC.3
MQQATNRSLLFHRLGGDEDPLQQHGQHLFLRHSVPFKRQDPGDFLAAALARRPQHGLRTWRQQLVEVRGDVHVLKLDGSRPPAHLRQPHRVPRCFQHLHRSRRLWEDARQVHQVAVSEAQHRQRVGRGRQQRAGRPGQQRRQGRRLGGLAREPASQRDLRLRPDGAVSGLEQRLAQQQAGRGRRQGLGAALRRHGGVAGVPVGRQGQQHHSAHEGLESERLLEAWDEEAAASLQRRRRSLVVRRLVGPPGGAQGRPAARGAPAQPQRAYWPAEQQHKETEAHCGPGIGALRGEMPELERRSGCEAVL